MDVYSKSLFSTIKEKDDGIKALIKHLLLFKILLFLLWSEISARVSTGNPRIPF